VGKQLIEKLTLIAEAYGKTFDTTYSNRLNGNMMTLLEHKRQIKFTQFADENEGNKLAKIIIDKMLEFGYHAELRSVEVTISPILEYVIEY